MKRALTLFIFCIFCFTVSSFAEEQPQLVISLDEASLLALSNSLDIQIAKFDAYRKRTALKKEESIFDTFLNAGAGYRDDQKKPVSTLLGTRALTHTYSLGAEKKLPTGTTVKTLVAQDRRASDSSVIPINPYYETQASISVVQSLGKNFFGLADRSKIAITKIDIENSDYSSLNEIESSLAKVQQAYWDLVYQKENLSIYKEMLEEAERLLDIYQERRQRGMAEDVDVFAAKANVTSRRNDVLIARLNRELANTTLLYLLNANDLSVNVMPSDSLFSMPQEVDLYANLKQAIEHRRDYKIVEGQLRAQNIDVKVKHNALWPEIDLEATYLRNGLRQNSPDAWADITSEDNPEVYMGVTVQFPLENREAKAELEESRLRKEQLILSLKRSERLILKELNNITKELNIYKSEAELRNRIVSLQEKKLFGEMQRMRYGRSDSDTLIRFAEELLAARLKLAASLYAYRLAEIRLQLAKNTLLDGYWKGEL